MRISYYMSVIHALRTAVGNMPFLPNNYVYRYSNSFSIGYTHTYQQEVDG